MKNLIFGLLCFFGLLLPQTANAVISRQTDVITQTVSSTDKKAENKKNGLWAGLIGLVCIVVGFVLTSATLQIAFLGTGVVMCIVGIVYLVKAML